jgi:hypothetical protein
MNTDGVTGNSMEQKKPAVVHVFTKHTVQSNPQAWTRRYNKNAGKCPSLPRLALSQPLNSPPPPIPQPPTPEKLPQQPPPCSLESLARSPGRNVRTLRACLSAGHLVATPSPTRATTLSAKDIDVGSRAGHGTSDTANRQIRDRDTRRWSARRGSVLFSPKSAMFSFIMRCEVLLLTW